jgi:hypothetical protein
MANVVKVNALQRERLMEPSTVPPICSLAADGTTPTIRDSQLIHQISRGGCGAVWVARHVQLRTESALKIVFDHAGAVEEDAIRLYKENVRIEDYAFLVPIEHFGRTEEGLRYYVMPLADDVSGPKVLRSATGYRPSTLAARLAGRGPFSLDELLEIADQLLLALTCLHGYGLVHRDVKPLNVLRVQQRWRLGDFGLMALRARLREQPDTTCGTYWYRPTGEPADFPVDVYALGKTLFVLATEATPPRKPGDLDPFVAFLGGSLRLKQDDARADQLRTILIRACATEAGDRATLDEMRRAISRLSTVTRWVQLRLPGDFDRFTEHDRREWLAKIEALGVVVLDHRVERGSVLLQVKLTAAQADYLSTLVRGGALAAWGITEVSDVPPGPGNSAGTGEQPTEPVPRPQTKAERPPASLSTWTWRFWFLVPLGAFALIFLGLFLRHHFAPTKENLAIDEPPAVVGIDPTPLIRVNFHDGTKDLNDAIGNQLGRGPTMRFGLEMLAEKEEGDPKKLTFDLWGRTNNTCLKVDDREILFGDNRSGRWGDRVEPRWKDAYGQEHEGMKSAWSPNRTKLIITQTVEVVPGEVTQDAKGHWVRYRDTCLVRYQLENADAVAHTVGLRFLLDTFIGANDGVPFVIPGEPGLCDTLKEFNDVRSVPAYIQAQEFDDLKNPGTVAHIQFKLGDPIEPPDRVTLGAWPHVDLKLRNIKAAGESTMWDVPMLPMSAHVDEARRLRLPGAGLIPLDSAVTMYWSPQQLASKETREVGFAFGLGKVSALKESSNFVLTGGAAAVEGHEFIVQAIVTRPAPGQTLTLTLHPGLKLAEGSPATQKVPAAAVARESSTVTWQIQAERSGVYRLEVKSDKDAIQTYPVLVRPVPSSIGGD